METISIILLFLVLIVASWEDLRHRRIPNVLTYGGIVIAFCLTVHTDYSTTQKTIGCLGLTLPLLLLYCCGGIGGGDVKLGACIGAFTGLETGISILFVGHLLAGTLAMLYLAVRSLGLHETRIASTVLRIETRTSVIPRGVPMAVFYLAATHLVAFGVL